MRAAYAASSSCGSMSPIWTRSRPRWPFLPNAPYAPGVTGIALSVQDREVLEAAAKEASKHPFHELASIISACVAQNLFEVRDHLRQDNKD
jgi:hypothetical protein